MQHSKSLPLLALILPAACSAASDPADTGTSKSDLIGFPQPIPTFPGPIPTFEPPPPAPPSCSGRCGEMGGPPSNVFEPCSCLSGCEADGTCCGDYETACTPETGSCFGFCGGQAPDGCWCDDACTSFGDCCVDESAACDGWPRAFGNSTGSQNGTAAIADGDSLFVTGVFEGTVDFGGKSLTRYPGDTTQDGFVARYSQTGSLVWVYGIRGPQQQWPHDVAVDGQGFVYVAGHFWNTVDFGDGVPRHPTQLYEIGFLALLGSWLALRPPRAEGAAFRAVLLGYLAFRLAVDLLKPGEPLLGLTAIQWACLAGLLYHAPRALRLLR